MIFAVNINSIMRQLIFTKEWKTKRMKAIRYNIINLPGLIRKKKNEFIIYMAEAHASIDILINARKRIMELACLPAG